MYLMCVCTHVCIMKMCVFDDFTFKIVIASVCVCMCLCVCVSVNDLK